MKRKLLFAAALLAGAMGFNAYAQDVQEPNLNIKNTLEGETKTSFYPLTSADYTIEVAGTASQEISIKSAGIPYTPEATGTVRFVRANNVVYVYEGATFKGT